MVYGQIFYADISCQLSQIPPPLHNGASHKLSTDSLLKVLPDPLKRINIFEEIASRKYIAAIEIEHLVENAD